MPKQGRLTRMAVTARERRDLMAVPAAPGTSEPIVRPAPHRWVWYALGGGLPERHRGWVLYDSTTETWWLRHIARMFVQLAIPIARVMLLLPAGWSLRAAV